MQAINSEVAAVVAGKPKQLLILRKLYGSLKIVMVNLKVEDQFFYFFWWEKNVEDLRHLHGFFHISVMYLIDSIIWLHILGNL